MTHVPANATGTGTGTVGSPLRATLEGDHRRSDATLEAFANAPANARLDRRELAAAAAGLRRHIYVEEELLFPPLHAAGLVGPILVMLGEHGPMWEVLDQLDQAVAAQAADDVLEYRCRRLLALLVHHNPKEERILYPQAEAILSAPQAQQVNEQLTGAARVPEGWICHNRR
ncbi:MAG: hemerythrin domain-containing protein [Mycobacteriales bacterium]